MMRNTRKRQRNKELKGNQQHMYSMTSLRGITSVDSRPTVAKRKVRRTHTDLRGYMNDT